MLLEKAVPQQKPQQKEESMSKNTIKRVCADNKERSFDTSPEACMVFGGYITDEEVTLTSGIPVKVVGVTDTICRSCRMQQCDRRRPWNSKSLWVEIIDSGLITECKEELLPTKSC